MCEFADVQIPFIAISSSAYLHIRSSAHPKLFLPEEYLHGASRKIKILAQLIFYKAIVRFF